MDAVALQQHLFGLYASGTLVDAVLRVRNDPSATSSSPSHWTNIRAHRIILSQAGYFRGLMTFNGGILHHPTPKHTGTPSQITSSAASEAVAVELTIENGDAPELTPSIVRALVEHLYGVDAAIDDENVCGLLFASSFFDVPTLTSRIADYCFQSLSRDNAVRFALIVEGIELGESGKLIGDAAQAFLLRNGAMEMSADEISTLPLSRHKQLLTSGDLYCSSEYQRFSTAMAMRRGALKRIQLEMAEALDQRRQREVAVTRLLIERERAKLVRRHQRRLQKAIAARERERSKKQGLQQLPQSLGECTGPLHSPAALFSVEERYDGTSLSLLAGSSAAGGGRYFNFLSSDISESAAPPQPPMAITIAAVPASRRAPPPSPINTRSLPGRQQSDAEQASAKATGKAQAQSRRTPGQPTQPNNNSNCRSDLEEGNEAHAMEAGEKEDEGELSLDSSTGSLDVGLARYFASASEQPEDQVSTDVSSEKRVVDVDTGAGMLQRTFQLPATRSSAPATATIDSTGVAAPSTSTRLFHAAVANRLQGLAGTPTQSHNSFGRAALNNVSSGNSLGSRFIAPVSPAAAGMRAFLMMRAAGASHNPALLTPSLSTAGGNINVNAGSSSPVPTPLLMAPPPPPPPTPATPYGTNASAAADSSSARASSGRGSLGERQPSLRKGESKEGEDDNEEGASVASSHSASSYATCASVAGSSPNPPEAIGALPAQGPRLKAKPSVSQPSHPSVDAQHFDGAQVAAVAQVTVRGLLAASSGSSAAMATDTSPDCHLRPQQLPLCSAPSSSSLASGALASPDVVQGWTVITSGRATDKRGLLGSGEDAIGMSGGDGTAGPDEPTDEDEDEADDVEIESLLPPLPPMKDYDAELQEVVSSYEEVFQGIRFVHFSEEQLKAALATCAVDWQCSASLVPLIQRGLRERQQLHRKLRIANVYNVKKLAELAAIPTSTGSTGTSTVASASSQLQQQTTSSGSTSVTASTAAAMDLSTSSGTRGNHAGEGGEIAVAMATSRSEAETEAEPEDPLLEDVSAVKDIAWPSFRFGVEVSGLFNRASGSGSSLPSNYTPLVDGDEPVSVASERIYFAGSCWSLDVKRYYSPPSQLPGAAAIASSTSAVTPGGEFVAVYLRRKPIQGTPYAALFEDSRDRTAVAFSIRLCGAPGSVTSNSVCGRSVQGKSFGVREESSWGWESFLSAPNLTDPATWQDDTLRFVISLDLL